MIQHLLVPLDGSKLAESALPIALEVAQKFDSDITLLRVVLPPYVVTHTAGATYASLISSLRDAAFEEAESYLKAQKGSLQGQGFRVHAKVIEGELVANVILDAAQKVPANLIVISTHGRGGFSRLVFGSVADKVIRQSTIPVLIVRSQEDSD